jgi:hypothetical protein
MMARSWRRWLAIVSTLCVALAVNLAPASKTNADAGGVAPNSTNMMDCNGHSTIYKSVKQDLGGLCTDPIAIWQDGTAWQFYDNGHYVGHDEPSVKFISSAPGSGNAMTYYMRLAVDPKAAPTTNPPTTTSPAVTDYAELSPAPWFGLPICDAKSYPQNPCTPDSDINQGQINNPNGAGSAFMELQFYPPGYQPFADAISCDPTHYCAALNIDSLECTYGFATCNGACIEPVNFAYLQTDGVPAGPPSPQLTNLSTFTPNAKTLLMNQGDMLQVIIHDTDQGLMTTVNDLTTGQSGFMVASAQNGFMNTNIADCSGTPYAFHAEYDTAQQQNQVPWAALEGGVLMEDELGHFEPCTAVTNPFPLSIDPNVYQTCAGGFEQKGNGHGQGPAIGEGPCDLTTGICTGATTQAGPCRNNNFTAGELCEYSDAFCMPAGPRNIFNNGQWEMVSWPVAGCGDNAFQNGDLDFDGSSYYPDWPDGSATYPTSFTYIGPFDSQSRPYPTVQFETDVAGSENLCKTQKGAGCTVPPLGARFYPFWTIGNGSSRDVSDLQSVAGQAGTAGRGNICVWNFGNVIAGTTTQTFGGPGEYGTPDVARYGGTLTSPPMPNPQFNGSCEHS